MGTNYYFKTATCKHCGRTDAPLHIGKSSAGWAFSLHVIPEIGINDFDDWVNEWSKPYTRIYDEYDRTLTREEMISIITCRSHPLGLRRHDVQGKIEAGTGTWDCMEGEFS